MAFVINYPLYINYNSFVVKKCFLSIFLLLCFNVHSFSYSFITFPFSYINKKTNNSNPIITTPKDYFESFLDNTVFTNLRLNNKDIRFHLTTERHTIYISDKNLKEEKSNKELLFSLEYIGITKAEFKNGTFIFLLNNTKNIIAENISYFIVKQMFVNKDNYTKKPTSYVSENDEIGFNIYKGNPYERVEVGDYDPTEELYDNIFDFDDNKTIINETSKKENNGLLKNGGYNIEENTNLIKQLKKNNIINSYTFLIKYNNKNEEKGEIIIGGLPHEYDPKHYSEDYYIYDYIPMDSAAPYNWHTLFNKITYGNASIADDFTYYKHVVFSLNFGFILASFKFKDYFYQKFFNNYEGLCQEIKIDKYITIYCQEKVVKYFKTLSFYLSNEYNKSNKNAKIEFDYNDLFIKSNEDPNIYYFQIVFTEYSNKWILGRPLFKKYPTVFDQEKKIYGFYLKTGEYEIYKEKNGKTIPWQWILVIFLGICVIILGIIICKILPMLPKRNKKANELDDDFVYESHDENNNSNEKNKLFND